MPKLDGVSATSLIRQFDHLTPIISMTSNSKPNEVVKYYSSGMNDILPKPFTKDDLLQKLEVELSLPCVPDGFGSCLCRNILFTCELLKSSLERCRDHLVTHRLR